MQTRTITLDAAVVARIERIAARRERTPDEVLNDILAVHDVEADADNWALELAQQMETADIDWKDEPNLSVTVRHQLPDQRLRRAISASDKRSPRFLPAGICE